MSYGERQKVLGIMKSIYKKEKKKETYANEGNIIVQKWTEISFRHSRSRFDRPD